MPPIREFAIRFRIGYELVYRFPTPTPIILVVNVHDSRYGDLVVSHRLTVDPSIPITAYRQSFGNRCNRVLAPAGRLRLAADGVINDSGLPDQVYVDAGQDAVRALPDETLVFLLGSRCCVTDLLSNGLGNSSAARLQGTHACRQFAITCINILRSTTKTPAPPAALRRLSTKAPASAVTMSIRPSHSAAA